MKRPKKGEWFKELVRITSFILKNPKETFSVLRAENISKSFQERLMLVVSGTNECRYCEFVHSTRAQNCGISKESIKELLDGQINKVPEDELPALKIAKKYAEKSDSEFSGREKLVEEYEDPKATEIELILRMIRFSNLTGIGFDDFLYRITKGLAGEDR